MAKDFNIAGACFPEDHYMADVSGQLSETFDLIEKGKYFIINRPRQYGKTTTMHTLRHQLIERGYAIFHISFEGLGSSIFQNEAEFMSVFVRLFSEIAHESVPELKTWLVGEIEKTTNFGQLRQFITELCAKTEKKVVVFIDEVDKSSNNQLFVDFLGLLRDMYLARKRTPTFHAVMLAGVHDVKTLKIKIRPDEVRTYNSPWNIAVPFNVDMNLSPTEIKPMLDDYAQEQNVRMNSQEIAEQLFYYTSGYPYLTSHLCKIIAESILPKKEVREWTKDDVFKSFQLIMKDENNANFDSQFKHIREFPDLYELVYSMVIDGLSFKYNNYSETMQLGKIYGIFKESETGLLSIHNRIYRELIADTMVADWQTSRKDNHEKIKKEFNAIDKYRLPNNSLDIKAVVDGFQVFMRQHYSVKDRDFLERNGRLIFLAYLKPIINGSGYDFKEPQTSEEKRLDVVITFFQYLYLVELKVWYGKEAHERGLKQLSDYLDRLGLDTGYLIIFDHSKKKTWAKDWEEVNGKRVYWVKV
jgi:hypothetical protein